MSDKVQIDPDSFTWAELIELEDHAKRPGHAVIVDWLSGRSTVNELAKIAHLVLRRTDPELTFEALLEQAAPAMLDSIELVPAEASPEDPPGPAEPTG